MIGERLSDLRKERGITQRQLADELHLTKYNISAYEREANEAPDSVKIAIANYFQVSIDYLLGMTDCPNLYERPGSHVPTDKKMPADLESVIECVRQMMLFGVSVNPELAERKLDELLTKIQAIRKEKKSRQKRNRQKEKRQGEMKTCGSKNTEEKAAET